VAALYDTHVACVTDEIAALFLEEQQNICKEASLDVEVQVSIIIDSFTERRQIDRKVCLTFSLMKSLTPVL
jgi:hypothetical protein